MGPAIDDGVESKSRRVLELEPVREDTASSSGNHGAASMGEGPAKRRSGGTSDVPALLITGCEPPGALAQRNPGLLRLPAHQPLYRGYDGKAKLVLRRAYGYRSFEN